MPDPDGIAMIVGGGKPPPASDTSKYDDEEEEMSDEPDKGAKAAKLGAARRLRMALDEGDDDAIASALSDAYKACAVEE